MNRHVAVIGGGMAGTAAAHWLLKRDYTVTIIEQNSRLGGRMYSAKINDLTSEMGAGFLTNHYTNTLAFLQEVGLSEKLLERKSGAAVMRDGVAHSLSDPVTFLGSSWLSFGAKVRLLGEMVRTLPAWRKLDLHDMWKADRFDTESVAQHLAGKYGRELVDYALGPAIDSYLYWSPQHTSYAVAMALIKTGSALGQRHTYILRGGLSQIPEAAARGCKVLLSHRAKGIEPAGGGYKIRAVGPAGAQTLMADGVVCATTASVVPKIIARLNPRQHGFFSSITYSSTAVASYRVERTRQPRTYAVAFPHKDGSPVAAMTVLADLSPKADAVKLYASGAVGKKLCMQGDKRVEAVLSAAVDLDLGPAKKTGTWRVQQWPEALPEFDVGHLKKLRAFANGDIEDQSANLVFAGDYIGGPFIDGAFTSGSRAAERLDKRLNRQ